MGGNCQVLPMYVIFYNPFFSCCNPLLRICAPKLVWWWIGNKLDHYRFRQWRFRRRLDWSVLSDFLRCQLLYIRLANLISCEEILWHCDVGYGLLFSEQRLRCRLVLGI